jgi:hypothetical protein
MVTVRLSSVMGLVRNARSSGTNPSVSEARSMTSFVTPMLPEMVFEMVLREWLLRSHRRLAPISKDSTGTGRHLRLNTGTVISM